MEQECVYARVTEKYEVNLQTRRAEILFSTKQDQEFFVSLRMIRLFILTPRLYPKHNWREECS